MKLISCDGCIYWGKVDGTIDGMKKGECRRYAPAMHSNPANAIHTRADYWCGEFLDMEDLTDFVKSVAASRSTGA